MEDAGAFYRYEGQDCVRHLFRVVSASDSMVIGETEILGQAIESFYENARAWETPAHSASSFQPRVSRRETGAQPHRNHARRSFGWIGRGGIGGEDFRRPAASARCCCSARARRGAAARALSSRGVTDIRVSNRSLERAETLAAVVARDAPCRSMRVEQCAEIDILISATSADEPLLNARNFVAIDRERLDRPLFIMISLVPRRRRAGGQ